MDPEMWILAANGQSDWAVGDRVLDALLDIFLGYMDQHTRSNNFRVETQRVPAGVLSTSRLAGMCGNDSQNL